MSWCSQAERCEGQTILQNLRAEESSFVFLVQGLWYQKSQGKCLSGVCQKGPNIASSRKCPDLSVA